MEKTAAEMALLKGLVKTDEEMPTIFSDYCNGPCKEKCFDLYVILNFFLTGINNF